MRRLIASLAVLVLAVLAGACGQSDTLAGPAVSASWAPDVDDSPTVYSVMLTPSASPSGVIALKAIRNGRVETVSGYRFNDLEAPGVALVEVGPRVIEASWTLPGSGEWLARGRASLPPGSQPYLTAWSGERLGPGELEGERVLWTQERYTGVSPSSGSAPMELAALVSASTQHPQSTFCCLTLELEGR